MRCDGAHDEISVVLSNMAIDLRILVLFYFSQVHKLNPKKAPSLNNPIILPNVSIANFIGASYSSGIFPISNLRRIFSYSGPNSAG